MLAFGNESFPKTDAHNKGKRFLRCSEITQCDDFAELPKTDASIVFVFLVTGQNAEGSC
jgi:hypothetical protein